MRRVLIATKEISGQVRWVSWIKQSTLLSADYSREVVPRRPAVLTAEWCMLLWMGSELGHSLWQGEIYDQLCGSTKFWHLQWIT